MVMRNKRCGMTYKMRNWKMRNDCNKQKKMIKKSAMLVAQNVHISESDGPVTVTRSSAQFTLNPLDPDLLVLPYDGGL